MSYLAGLLFPGNERSPQINCDFVGCDARVTLDGLPPSWFIANRPPPGWATIRDMGRRDYCPQHKPASRPTRREP